LAVWHIKAFILHLERATQRRAQVERLQASLPTPSEILPAVDGAGLSADEIARAYIRERYRPRYPFRLQPAEIGAFLSHRSAWRRIIDNGLDFALIFEDDAEIDPLAIRHAIQIAETGSAEYICLPADRSTVSGAEPAALKRPSTPPLRAIAQIVSRSAAERLLAVSAPFDRPVDSFVQMAWIAETSIATLSPSGVRDVCGVIGGSTISRKRKPLLDRLTHEVARPFYRCQIATYNFLNGFKADGRRV
jgi:GR25 family glycosyltransferase involved in LPS biosynthesis